MNGDEDVEVYFMGFRAVRQQKYCATLGETPRPAKISE
jgi:hypothetical protein